MSPTTQSHRSPTVHDPAETSLHHVALRFDEDPLLLQRVLQKCAVPEIRVVSVRYLSRSDDAQAEIELQLRCTPARAALTAEKLRKLVRVHDVDVAPSPKPGESGD